MLNPAVINSDSEEIGVVGRDGERVCVVNVAPLDDQLNKEGCEL